MDGLNFIMSVIDDTQTNRPFNHTILVSYGLCRLRMVVLVVVSLLLVVATIVLVVATVVVVVLVVVVLVVVVLVVG